MTGQPATGLASWCLSLLDSDEDRKDKLSWSWSGDEMFLADLGSPTSTTAYRLCAYDEADAPGRIVLAKTIPAGGTCGKKPCWKETEGKGFTYKNKVADDPIDIQSLKLSADDEGSGKITLRGKGANLDFESLPWTSQVTVQLYNMESGVCWESSYSSFIVTNDGERFVAKGN